MGKKFYTGAHLLAFQNRKGQFGTIDASYIGEGETEKVRVSLRIDDLENLCVEEGFVTFEIDFEQLHILSNVANTVFERIQYLKILSQRGKLREDAFPCD
jgi:hypothetical protein